MESLSCLFKDIDIQDILSIATFIAMLIGGCFALPNGEKGFARKGQKQYIYLLKQLEIMKI